MKLDILRYQYHSQIIVRPSYAHTNILERIERENKRKKERREERKEEGKKERKKEKREKGRGRIRGREMTCITPTDTLCKLSLTFMIFYESLKVFAISFLKTPCVQN